VSNLIGSGIGQIPTNGMLGNLAFQDKAYVNVDKVGIGTTFVDSGTAGQILQVYGGGAYVSGSVGIGTTNPLDPLDVVGVIRPRLGIRDSYGNVGAAGSVLVSTGAGVSWTASFSAGLQGTQGVQGLQGLQGVQGVQGLSNQGVQGHQGTQGLKGDQGVQGTGNQGVQGTQGLKGDQGLQGVQGLSNQGIQGHQGTQGVQGTGTQGTQGTGNQGTQGLFGTQGSQGLQGLSGKDGNFGGATFDYTFNTDTTNTDPGIGNLKFNNLNLTLASELYIDDQNDGTTDIQSFLRTIDDSTSTIKGHFRISNKFDASDFALFTISSIVEQTGYFQVDSSYVSGSATSFTNAEDVIITFARTGDKGDTGSQGAQGTSGSQGSQGLQGVQGLSNQGVQGHQGTQGLQGLSNQGVQGHQGTQGLKGDQGTQGLSNQGAQGSQGRQGLQGLSNQGSQGVAGTTQGSQGLQGLSNQGSQGVAGTTQGSQGLQGVQGTGNQGTQGVAGTTQGSQGLQGVQGTGNQGTQGPAGTTQGSQGLQGLSNQGSQGLSGQNAGQGGQGLQGVQGTGNQGTQGVAGTTQGSQGLQGLSNQGSQGLQGLKGDQGTQGLQGLSNQGAQGSQGRQGLQGLSNQGSQGLAGTTQGSQGLQGVQGTGNQGTQGLAGTTQGSQGLQGVQGTGNQGTQGLAGTTQGSQGLQGLSNQGSQGLAGTTQGSQGLQGLSNQGTQGLQGLSNQGTQGLQGRQGTQGISIQGLQGSAGSGGVSAWSRKTAIYTAVTGDRLIADTSGGAFTITLPATPTTGDNVTFADGADWFTNNLTVARNGSTIEGVADDFVLDIKGITVEFVYDGTTWELFASTGPAGPNSVINATDDTTTATLYPVMVGATGSNQTAKARSTATAFSFNASTNTLSAANVYVNTTTATGTASQPLQVSGGAYVSENLGIGVTNPTFPLEVLTYASVPRMSLARVNGSAGSPTGVLSGEIIGNINYRGHDGTSLSLGVANITASAEENYSSTSRATRLTFGTTNVGNPTLSAKMYLTGAGDLLIGSATTTGTASQRLQVSGGTYVSGNLGIGTANPTSKLHVIGDVLVSGVVTCTDLNTTSDVSLKDNVQTFTNALDIIENIRGVRFEWKKDNKPSIGVIAQELEDLLPELVNGNNPKTVNYNGLIGVLIEAVKEQQLQINTLRNEIDRITKE